MTQWIVRHGDILDEPADLLICSANGFLDLSGGVGAAIRMRHGMAMQEALHAHRSNLGVKAIPRGEIAVTPACGTHFKLGVIHAIAVDVFYQSDAGVVTELVDRALTKAAELGAARVALVALATGYGPLSMTDFANGVRPLRNRAYGSITSVAIVVRRPHEAEELSAALASTQALPTKQ